MKIRGLLALTALTAILSARAGAQTPRPAPARAVWVGPSAPGPIPPAPPLDQHLRSTGCGEACSLGATIGIIAGGFAGFYVGALRESHTGWPILIGAIAGGLTGAMVGSGLDNDAPPKVDSTRVAGP